MYIYSICTFFLDEDSLIDLPSGVRWVSSRSTHETLNDVTWPVAISLPRAQTVDFSLPCRPDSSFVFYPPPFLGSVSSSFFGRVRNNVEGERRKVLVADVSRSSGEFTGFAPGDNLREVYIIKKKFFLYCFCFLSWRECPQHFDGVKLLPKVPPTCTV